MMSVMGIAGANFRCEATCADRSCGCSNAPVTAIEVIETFDSTDQPEEKYLCRRRRCAPRCLCPCRGLRAELWQHQLDARTPVSRAIEASEDEGALRCPRLGRGFRCVPRACRAIWRALARNRSGSAHSIRNEPRRPGPPRRRLTALTAAIHVWRTAVVAR